MPRTKYPVIIHETYQSKFLGRPKSFTTPEEMQIAIDEYFLSCHEEQIDRKTGQVTLVKTKPYTVTGLALALDLTTEGLRNYEHKEQYQDFFWTVRRAKHIIEEQLDEQLLTSRGQVAGVIFNLKNNFNQTWKDKTEQDITSGGFPIQHNADERAKDMRQKMLAELTVIDVEAELD